MKPRVLMITARADYGGGPEHIYRLMQTLNEDIIFFAACPVDKPYMERYKKLLGTDRIIQIPHRKLDYSSIKRLKNFIKTSDIQIIHSHGKGAGIYGRILSAVTGRPCVHTFHGLHTGNYGMVQKAVYLTIERVLGFYTRVFITVSPGEQKLIKQNRIAAADKLRMIYNGVRIPDKRAGAEVLDKKRLRLITFTRFDFAKNSMLLIDILSELRKRQDKFEVLILGSGEEEAAFKKKAEEAGLTDIIIMPGQTEDTSKYLLDAFCYISTSRWEGLPLGVIEAMSYGIPAAATDVTGNNDVVSDGINGYLYNINDHAEAAEKIIRLAEKEVWLRFSEQAARTAAEKFNIKIMAEKTKQIYYNMMETRD